MQKSEARIRTAKRETQGHANGAAANRVRVAVGLAMVLISVVLGFLTANLAVGIGLALLAAFRLLILWREMRR